MFQTLFGQKFRKSAIVLTYQDDDCIQFLSKSPTMMTLILPFGHPTQILYGRQKVMELQVKNNLRSTNLSPRLFIAIVLSYTKLLLYGSRIHVKMSLCRKVLVPKRPLRRNVHVPKCVGDEMSVSKCLWPKCQVPKWWEAKKYILSGFFRESEKNPT